MNSLVAPGVKSAWKTRALIAAPIVVTILALVGLAFVHWWWDKRDIYGEMAVPGQAELHLPEGPLEIGFDAAVRGRSKYGSSQPIPALTLWITAPAGVAQSDVITTPAGATEVTSASGPVTVWNIDLPAAGVYSVRVESQLSAYDEPRLTFGHSNWLVPMAGKFFIYVLAAGLVGDFALVVVGVNALRKKRRVNG